MNIQDLNDWKKHPVTQTISSQIQRRIDTLTEELVNSAGHNPVQDAYKRGVILAHRDFLDIEFEESQSD